MMEPMANTAFLEVEVPPLGSWANPTTPKLSLVLDRPRDFIRAVHELLEENLLRCEERYPRDVEFSVLYVVIKDNPAKWREKILGLHVRYFGPENGDPLAPVRLEIVDLATDHSVSRLIELGLLSKASRAARVLWPEESCEPNNALLSELEREKALALREQALRKLKVAQVLGEANLCEEARTALLEAMLPLGRALAIEKRLPEPADINEILLPPLAHHWQDALITLRLFTSETMASWRPVLECLSRV